MLHGDSATVWFSLKHKVRVPIIILALYLEVKIHGGQAIHYLNRVITQKFRFIHHYLCRELNVLDTELCAPQKSSWNSSTASSHQWPGSRLNQAFPGLSPVALWLGTSEHAAALAETLLLIWQRFGGVDFGGLSAPVSWHSCWLRTPLRARVSTMSLAGVRQTNHFESSWLLDWSRFGYGGNKEALNVGVIRSGGCGFWRSSNTL